MLVLKLSMAEYEHAMRKLRLTVRNKPCVHSHSKKQAKFGVGYLHIKMQNLEMKLRHDLGKNLLRKFKKKKRRDTFFTAAFCGGAYDTATAGSCSDRLNNNGSEEA
jgi:hypothetical protein